MRMTRQGKLLSAGEVIGLGAAQAERASGGHQVKRGSGAELRDGHGCHVSSWGAGLWWSKSR